MAFSYFRDYYVLQLLSLYGVTWQMLLVRSGFSFGPCTGTMVPNLKT